MFGNLVATAEFAATTDWLQISSDVTVEQSAPAWPLFRIAPHAHAFPFRYSPDEIAELGALLQPQHHDDGTLKGWMHAFVQETPTDTLSLLKADFSRVKKCSLGLALRSQVPHMEKIVGFLW